MAAAVVALTQVQFFISSPDVPALRWVVGLLSLAGLASAALLAWTARRILAGYRKLPGQ